MTDVNTEPIVIPGNDLPLQENDLYANVGKYLTLLEHEQKKRVMLAQAYVELKTELDNLKATQT